MKNTLLGQSTLESSRLVYGCMRIADDPGRGKAAIRAALEAGFNHFDHADIYGQGRSETLFGEILTEQAGLRERVLITSKCGIRWADEPRSGDPHRFDFSRDYMLASVDGSLARLQTDYLDLLLLHRPDYLLHPDEVCEAFSRLHDAGKVRHFGVSNFSPSQLSMLQSRCPYPLLVNQVEINIFNIDSLLDGTLDQCLEQRISPQAWCPLGGVVYPAWGGSLAEEQEERVRREFERQAQHYQVETWLIMLAWLLKHPAGILPIVGSTTPQRIRQAVRALDLEYSREDWYRLMEARNGEVP